MVVGLDLEKTSSHTIDMMTRGVLKFGVVAFCYDRVLGTSGAGQSPE